MAIDPTDIFALVLLAVFWVRRSEAKATDPHAFPDVPSAEFERWKRQAVAARTFVGNACLAKVGLNTLWFFGLRSHVSPAVLATGGRFLFLAWLLAIAWGLFRGLAAGRLASRLGIVEGRRLVEAPPDAPGG